MPDSYDHVEGNLMQKSHPLKNTSGIARIVLMGSVLLAICLLVLPASANPPSDISVNYDKTTEQLSVTITHPVDDPATHHIRNVKVTINDRVAIDKDYQTQPAKGSFTYTYPVQVTAGDVVKVTASCNLAGSRDAVLTLPTPSGTTETIPPSAAGPVPTTRSAPGFLPFAVLGMLGILVLSKKRK
jgi:hypothetical protein